MTSTTGPNRRLRVGVVGCGQIAEYHARFIKQLPHAELVGAADVDSAAARRFAEAHGIPHASTSIDDLLTHTEPDVLHVLSPPGDHYQCAKTALQRGIHVFVEKPVALSAREVVELYEHADANNVLLCPDFLQLFHPKMRALSALIQSGELGPVVHVESHWCIDPCENRQWLEAEGLHWRYCVPGGLLRDYACHLLYLTLSLVGVQDDVHVVRRANGTLPQNSVDHMTVSIQGAKSTAIILLSCRSQFHTYGIRVFCEKGSAEVDFDTQSLLVTKPVFSIRKLASAATNFVKSYGLCSEALRNITNYLTGHLVPYAGMRSLIQQFYCSILDQATPPILPELVKAVSWAEEQIFSHLPEPCLRGRYLASAQGATKSAKRVLVTGANGYVGVRVVKALVESGYFVRAMVRPASSPEQLKKLGVEVFLGDVRRRDDVMNAADTMQLIVHLAAGMKGSSSFILDTCVRGTQNVADAAALRNVERVIYMSSLSVYDFANLRNGDVISESSGLEEQPATRGAYSLAKRRAEDVALSHLGDKTASWTILRPSYIVGHGREAYGAFGTRIGNTLACLSRPGRQLAIVHVDDVAAAIVQILQKTDTEGRVYTISDPHAITVATYIKTCVVGGNRGIRVAYIPYSVAALGALIVGGLSKMTHLAPIFDRRRLFSTYRDVRVDSTSLQRDTGWQPSCQSLLNRLNREAEDLRQADQQHAVYDLTTI